VNIPKKNENLKKEAFNEIWPKKIKNELKDRIFKKINDRAIKNKIILKNSFWNTIVFLNKFFLSIKIKKKINEIIKRL